MKKDFYKESRVELELIKSYIWQMMKFDEFFMTSVLSKLKIEELNHTLITPKGLDSSILLGYHYMLLDITGGSWDPQKLIDGQ